jgi:hypothetical protein
VVRWIAFDDDTAEAVVSRLRRGAAEILHSDPIDAALSEPSPSLVILPSRVAGRLLVARFAPRKPTPTPADPFHPIPPGVAAREPRPRKSWWSKLIN